MATKNLVPNATGEGEIGTSSKKWNKVYANEIYADDPTSDDHVGDRGYNDARYATAAQGAAVTTHTAASSAHGVSGSIVGTSDAQTLSNKTWGSQEITASGTVTPTANFVKFNHATVAIAGTLAAPVEGQQMVVSQVDSGTVGHTLTLSAGTFDGTNTVATFDAQYKSLVLFGVSSTRFIIVENVGSVALS